MEKLAPNQTFEVVEGQTYAAPELTIDGYKVSSRHNTKGIYNAGADAIFYYVAQKETVHIYYIYLYKGEEYEYSSKVLSGAYGDTYTTNPLDLLNDGGNWILKKIPNNATGIYTTENSEVDYYYLIDKESDSLHKDGSETYIDRTADNRLGILHQYYADGSETILERRNFGKKVYLATFLDSKGEVIKTVTYDFGSSHIIHDQSTGNTQHLKIYDDGKIELYVTIKADERKIDNMVISRKGKVQSYSLKDRIIFNVNQNFTSNARDKKQRQQGNYPQLTRRDGSLQSNIGRMNSKRQILQRKLPQTNEQDTLSIWEQIIGILLIELSALFKCFKKGE